MQKKTRNILIASIVSAIIVVVALVCVLIFATKPKSFNCTINYAYGLVQESTLNLKKGTSISEIIPIEIEGYTFDGYYFDQEFNEKV